MKMFKMSEILRSEYDGSAGAASALVTQGYNPALGTTDTNPPVYTASGAIGKLATTGMPAPVTINGLVILNGTGALAMTLALPTAGVDDGKRLRVLDVTGKAHTITTPANGINGAGHSVVTMTGAIGNEVAFVAWKGSWYFVAGSGTVTT